MFSISIPSPETRSRIDAEQARRFYRLAEESTGIARRILLYLAKSARPRQVGNTIDLFLVPLGKGQSTDSIRTYAQ